MSDSTQDLILEELQLLRRDFSDFSRDTAGRVSSLETDVRSLVGNGQPGRVALLERAVSKLSQWRWWLVGCAAGSSGVISAIAWVIVASRKQ